MKILIVSDLSIYAIGHSFASALKSQGHEVETFDVQESINKFIKFGNIGQKIHTFWPVEAWIRKGNRELAVYFQRFKPDYVIVSGNAPVMYGTLAFWKSILPKVKLILFWPDMLTNLQPFHINCASLYDNVATYSNATVSVFKQMGFRNATWLPFAGDVDFLGSKDIYTQEQYDYDLSFIGGWRPERERAILSIIKSFPNLRLGIRGTYWLRESRNKAVKNIANDQPLYGHSYGAFIRSSYINLNVIDDTNYPAANMRFFEIPAAGGLQLSSSCPEQENIFIDAEHILYFKSDKQMCDQINTALISPDKATKIRVSSHELIIKSHMYNHRMEQLLKSGS